MNNNFLKQGLFAAGIATAVGLGMSAPTHALTLTETQTLTSDGGDLNFSFTGPASDGSDGVLNLANALGSNFDLGTLSSNALATEFFDVIIEGVNLGRYSCGTGNGVITMTGCNNSFNNNVFDQDIVLAGSDLQNWFADGVLNLTVDFSDGVNTRFSSNRDLVATLTYSDGPGAPAEVPTPAAVLPILSGLFATARRKKNSVEETV